MATTLWPLSANRDCSILAVSIRALAVLRKVSSLNNCSSSLTLLLDCSKIASRSKIDFCAYCLVFIYFCGPISLQLRDIMLISLISKTISFRLKYKVSFGPLLKWETSLIICHPAKRIPLIPPSISSHNKISRPLHHRTTLLNKGNHCGCKRDVPHFCPYEPVLLQ